MGHSDCDIEWARARDARTGALKEFLLGIKVIKVMFTLQILHHPAFLPRLMGNSWTHLNLTSCIGSRSCGFTKSSTSAPSSPRRIVVKCTICRWQRWRFTLGTAFNVLADQLPILSILIAFAFHTKIMGRPLDAPTAFVALTMCVGVYLLFWRKKEWVKQLICLVVRLALTVSRMAFKHSPRSSRLFFRAKYP